jgi:transglutaminase-like putative cysteine protease
MANDKGINFKKLIPVVLIIVGIFLLNVPRTLEETTYVDVSHDKIRDLIERVEAGATTDTEKIALTAEIVNDLVTYKITGSECFDQKASDVLFVRKGDCVSTSKTIAAALTGMNIPVVIVEGCVFNPEGRAAIRPFEIPENPFVKLPIPTGRRGPHNGQLHSWIRAYDGVRWWTVETTAGVAFTSQWEQDFGYDKFRFVDHSDPNDLCLLENDDYALWCMEY